MALKAFSFILAFFLLLTSAVLSERKGTISTDKQEAYVSVPATAPVHPPAPAPYMFPVNKTECPRLCGDRCNLHSRPRHCNRVCCTCCERCKCVPPGTAGNRELCGKCYTDMTTHGNRTKCP